MTDQPWALEETLRDLLREAITQTDFLKHDESRRHETEKWNNNSSKQQKGASDQNKKSLGLLNKVMLRGTATTTRLMKSFIVGQSATRKVFKEEMQRVVEGLEAGAAKGAKGAGIGRLFGVAGMALGVFATAVTAVTHKIKEAGDIYIDLMNKGQGLSGSLADLWLNSGRAGMRLSDYSNALSEYSEVMKSLTTATESGYDVFFDMAKGIRENSYALGNFGLSVGEINDYLGDYLETMRLTGHLENINSHSQRVAVQNYIGQITELANITGKHRKQIMDETQDMMRTPSMSTIMSQYADETVRTNITSIMTSLTALGPEFATAGMSVAAYGSVIGDQALVMSRLGLTDELQNLIAMGEAGVDVSTELHNFMRTAVEAGKAFDGTSYAVANMVDGGFDPLLETLAKLRGIDLDALDQGPTIRSNMTNLFAIFDTLITEGLSPFNEMLGRVIESFEVGLGQNIIKDFMNTIKLATDGIEAIVGEGKIVSIFMTGIAELLGWVIKGITTFLSDVETLGFKTTITNMFRDVGEIIGSAITSEVGNAFAEVIPFWNSRSEQTTEDWETLLRDARSAYRGDDAAAIVTAIEQLQAFEADKGLSISDRPTGGSLSFGEGLAASMFPAGYFDVNNPAYGGLTPHARGGIANQASIFGEAGPEAAIPLDSGQRIPIAEIKGDFNKEEMKEMISLLKELVQRQEVTAETTVQVQKAVEKAGSNARRSGNALF